jgi:hypothetical protein
MSAIAPTKKPRRKALLLSDMGPMVTPLGSAASTPKPRMSLRDNAERRVAGSLRQARRHRRVPGASLALTGLRRAPLCRTRQDPPAARGERRGHQRRAPRCVVPQRAFGRNPRVALRRAQGGVTRRRFRQQCQSSVMTPSSRRRSRPDRAGRWTCRGWSARWGRGPRQCGSVTPSNH